MINSFQNPDVREEFWAQIRNQLIRFFPQQLKLSWPLLLFIVRNFL